MLITGNDSTQEPDNPNKKSKKDSIIDEKKHNKKRLHHIKISKTMLMVIMIRHVNPMILQVILMVVQ